jgi:hypothetical protein
MAKRSEGGSGAKGGGAPKPGRKTAKMGRPPSAAGPKYNVLSIRGTAEWRDWLNRLADHCRLKSADVIDRALIVYAKQEGFTEPPPKR